MSSQEKASLWTRQNQGLPFQERHRSFSVHCIKRLEEARTQPCTRKAKEEAQVHQVGA